jgi:putative redox protein
MTGNRTVEVRGAGHGHVLQEITVGGHRLVADEPAPIGGDEGATPHEIALAGLGACTAMTLRLYAELKKLALKDVIVRLSYVTEDGTGPDGKPARIDHVTREIEIVGDIDDAMRQRMLQIAERCPVHRMMTGYAKFDTSLKG